MCSENDYPPYDDGAMTQRQREALEVLRLVRERTDRIDRRRRNLEAVGFPHHEAVKLARLGWGDPAA